MFPITGAQWPSLTSWLNVMKSLPEYEINRKGLEELKDAIEVIGKFKFPYRQIVEEEEVEKKAKNDEDEKE